MRTGRGELFRPTCYLGDMSKEQVKAILDRVLTWPSERQEDAAKLLTLMESQDESIYRLTDEQVEEVRRRRADPNAVRLTLDEFNERMRSRLGE
jgi:hypothetical protein